MKKFFSYFISFFAITFSSLFLGMIYFQSLISVSALPFVVRRITFFIDVIQLFLVTINIASVLIGTFIIFAFSSIQYDQQNVLKGIRSVAPDIPIVGGSAAGEITSWATVFDAVNVMAIATDQITFATGIGTGVSEDSFKASSRAAQPGRSSPSEA